MARPRRPVANKFSASPGLYLSFARRLRLTAMQAAARDSSGTGAPCVFWLSEYGGSYGGGAVAMVKRVDHYCRERGWRLECGYTSIAREQAWLADLAAAEIPVAFAPDGRRAKAEWLAEKLDRLDGPAILHTHFAGFDLAALAVSRGRPNTATIWHVHSFLRRDPPHLARSILKYGWLSRRGVSRIVCVSEVAAESVRRRGGPAALTTVVANGIETESFALASPEQRQAARASLGLAEAELVLLHFGWEWKVKGGALFVEALARLHADGVAARGLVVAGGEEFRRAADRLGIGEALLIAPPSEDVRRFYDAADLLLATSPAEGGGPPLAVVEALSCGTGVVATDIPGHRVAGRPPAALRLVPAEPGAVAAGVRAAIAAPADQRRAEAAEGHRWVATERNGSLWMRRMGEVYTEALAEL
ncbi:MAG: hypothetical protein QOI10_1513 [Solirubrobacterales bacterium]|nr:hypothetical protein [Solirubrobacterales bacterium]